MDISLFSIAIVSYNQWEIIRECVDSILKQDYSNIELIICDDFSCDFDAEKLREYIVKQKKDNIKNVIVYQQPNNVGIVKNCNTAAKFAKGELFKVIAADDKLFGKDVLTKISKTFYNPDINIICARARACTEKGILLNQYYPSDYDFSLLKQADPKNLFYILSTRPWSAVFAPSVFWRTSFLQKMGYFDETYKYTEDWPMWLKISSDGYNIHFIDVISVLYRYGGISNKTNEEMVNPLRKFHYQECVDFLKKQSLPVLEKEYSKIALMRCRWSIRCIENRSLLEYNWTSYGIKEKLKYKLNNFSFTCYVKLMTAITYNRHFSIKKEAVAFLMLTLLLLLNISVYPGVDTKILIAVLLLLTCALLTIKIVCNIILYVLQKRSRIMTIIRGR